MEQEIRTLCGRYRGVAKAVSGRGHSKDDVKDEALGVSARTIRELGPGLGLAKWLGRLSEACRALESAEGGPDALSRKLNEVERDLPSPQNRAEQTIHDAFIDAIESLQSSSSEGGSDAQMADIENRFTHDVVEGLCHAFLDPQLPDLLGSRFQDAAELTEYARDLYDGLDSGFGKLAGQWLEDPIGGKVRKPRSRRRKKSTEEHLGHSLL